MHRRTVIGAGAAMAAGASPAFAASFDWDVPKLKTMQADGRWIAYYDVGVGRPLVLIHGMSGSAAMEWGRVMTPLARRYRVIAPYLVGFKPSEQPDMAYDAKTFVDSLADMFSQLLLDEPVLAGESFGGWVVAQYALQQETRPELPKISKLVIVDGAVRVAPRPPGSPDTASKSINDPAVAALVGQKFGKELSADNSLVRGKVLGGTIFQGALGPEALAKITTPTLLIWGAGDQLIPLSDGQAFAAEIPHAKLVAIPDCGHIPSVERPEAFVKAIREFAG